MGFPHRKPLKGGTQVAKRRKFSGLGEADAGRPGTKVELRQAKHRAFGEGGRGKVQQPFHPQSEIQPKSCTHHRYGNRSQPKCTRTRGHAGTHSFPS